MNHRNILLVDHCPQLYEGLCTCEAAEGWSLHHADHVEQALALLEVMPVDAVLSESSPPGMEGLDFLAAVRTRWPRSARLLVSDGGPLEAITDALRDGTIERLLDRGAEPANVALAIDAFLVTRAAEPLPERERDDDEPEVDEFRIESDELDPLASHSAWADESGAPEPPAVITLDADAVDQDVDDLLEALQAELEREPDTDRAHGLD